MAITRKAGTVASLLELQRSNPARYPHLLQSAERNGFDILFACPGDSLVLDNEGRLQLPGASATGSGRFLDSLDTWWQASAVSRQRTDFPFTGGWFVYLGYELAAEIEPVLDLPRATGGLPVAFATRFATAVLHERVSGNCYIVGEPRQASAVAAIASDIDRLPATSRAGTAAVAGSVDEEPDSRYLQAVECIRDYIRDGDVFQVNLSRQWRILLDALPDPASVYASLCRHNPSPFSGIARWKDTAIISSSPERLVRVRGQQIETRPIAGTRPRGQHAADDVARSEELLGHPKERAEHIMLIDLERNDLGRLCEPGSIEVNEFMVLESYRHVHHIVSNVRGSLRASIRPGDVLRAVFPGGTITGCPKVRCMEIIAELEGTAREAYTGSMGYLNLDGSMDMNILIRTMLLRQKEVVLRAGAGIVADSVPAAELEETRDKARGLLRSLGLQQV